MCGKSQVRAPGTARLSRALNFPQNQYSSDTRVLQYSRRAGTSSSATAVLLRPFGFCWQGQGYDCKRVARNNTFPSTHIPYVQQGCTPTTVISQVRVAEPVLPAGPQTNSGSSRYKSNPHALCIVNNINTQQRHSMQHPTTTTHLHARRSSARIKPKPCLTCCGNVATSHHSPFATPPMSVILYRCPVLPCFSRAAASNKIPLSNAPNRIYLHRLRCIRDGLRIRRGLLQRRQGHLFSPSRRRLRLSCCRWDRRYIGLRFRHHGCLSTTHTPTFELYVRAPTACADFWGVSHQRPRARISKSAQPACLVVTVGGAARSVLLGSNMTDCLRHCCDYAVVRCRSFASPEIASRSRLYPPTHADPAFDFRFRAEGADTACIWRVMLVSGG